MSRNTAGTGWWNWHSRSGRGRAARSRQSDRHRVRPQLLALENRRLLATFTVTNTNSSGTGSLSYEIGQANSSSGASTIDFDATDFSTPQTITLGGSELVLSDPIGLETIIGPAAGVTISGGGKSRVFQVGRFVQASLSGLTIVGGKVSGQVGYGGGLYNSGFATLTDCTISGNSAGDDGGGIYNRIGGQLFLTDCTISGNSGAGGLENNGYAILTDCTVSGNSASTGAGWEAGGIFNAGAVVLTDTIVAGNKTQAGASDIDSTIGNTVGSYNLIGTGGSGQLADGVSDNIVLKSLSSLGLSPLGDYGGPTQTMALLPGSAAIRKGESTAGVTTDQRGLALDSTPDIGAFQTQPGLVVNTTIDSAGSPSGDLSLRQAVNLANLLDSAETITFDPKAFASAQTITLAGSQLELSDTNGMETIAGPAAGVTISGGGQSRVLQVGAHVTASLSGLTITGGDSASDGGGLDNGSTAKLTLTDCTVSGNSAVSDGGGLYNGGAATLTDCTISGNSAEDGGGLDNAYTANNLTVTDCTISGNSAANDGGGLENLATAKLTDTIVAGNTKPSGGSDDIHSPGTLLGTYNLIGTGGSGGFTNGGAANNIVLKSLSSLGLAALGFYGGPTQTMALSPGSAAIRKGESTSGVKTDQRGFALDTKPDIGSFQTQPGLVVNTTIDGTDAPSGDLSLRQALNLANVLTGATTISFDPKVFATAQTITLGGTELDMSKTNGMETITGPAAGVTLSGGGLSRVLQVDAHVSASLAGMTINAGESASDGGGLDNGSTATVTLTDCTISGNSAGDHGGGLYNGGTAQLTDCTISGNSAKYGGGLYNSTGGGATLTGCTISSNSAHYGGGLYDGGKATLTDTIVAGNTNASGASANDIHGAGTVSGSYNLIGTGGSGGLANAGKHNNVLKSLSKLGLAKLGSNGGPTQTMALSGGSAAIAMGEMVTGVATDQRGLPLDSPAPDIGAFQSQPTVALGASAGSAVFGQNVTFVATVTALGGVPTGKVTFSDNGTVLGTGSLDGSGKATLTASSLPVGTNSITASFSGETGLPDANVAHTAVSVARAGSHVVLVTLEGFKKQKVVSLSLEAKIEPVSPGAGVPTGTVTFELLPKNNKPKVLGMASLSGGMATLSVKPASVLNELIKIIYSGDADFETSTSTGKIT